LILRWTESGKRMVNAVMMMTPEFAENRRA